MIPSTTENRMGVRRLDTGHDQNGKAIVIADAEAAIVVRPDNWPGVVIHNLWQIDVSPAGIFGAEETTDRTLSLDPPYRAK